MVKLAETLIKAKKAWAMYHVIKCPPSLSSFFNLPFLAGFL